MRKILILISLLAAACADNGYYTQDSLIGASRPPRDFPKTGYVLGDDGTYVFKPLQMRK